MDVRDVTAIREQFSKLDARANESLGSFDNGNVGIGRYVPGASPWERHNNGDELLFILDGAVQIEVLGADSRRSSRTCLRAASSPYREVSGISSLPRRPYTFSTSALARTGWSELGAILATPPDNPLEQRAFPEAPRRW